MKSARLLFLALAAACLCAQPKFEFWPGVPYDAKVPSFETVLGYAPGEKISSHAEILRYFEALAAAEPHHIKLFPYARTWEGRQLIYAAVGSETNIKRLGEIQSQMKRLADPRKTNAAEAKRLIAGLPAVIWLAYGVHGNEISSPDAAMLTAYHLLAARGHQLTSDVLANTLVILDPTQNADGRDRFVHNFYTALGLEPDASPVSAEHNEPWPGGRTNHYHFDLNRDWLAVTQPETAGHVKALLEWYPLVFVDLHEMGSNSTYYFAPEADPYNPHLAADQRAALQLFGKNNAKWFDQFRFDYFTRDVYDAFYPGYGASWPAYYGGVAMTYEQASVRGLVIRRSDESSFRFRDTVRQHFVASLSTAETAARHREKLLNEFYRYRVTAIEEGSKEQIREYVLPRGRDAAATDKLAGILVEQGVEVRRAKAEFRAGGVTYPAGTYAISLAQPAKRLIRTLLDPDTPMDEKFAKEQERLRKRKLPDNIYDVTAWSLPSMFNVPAVPLNEALSGSFEPATAARILPGTVTGEKATVAYLAPWGSAASGRLLTAALRDGIRVYSADKPLKQNGVEYPSGTLIIKVRDNPADLHERLVRLAAQTGAQITATNTGWVDEGINFGSRYVFHLRKPNVAIAWDAPAQANAAGATRFVLERQYGYPVTPIRIAQLAAADLSRFHVLILPEQSGFGGGSYASALGPNGVRRLKDWVAAGGTVIGINNAVSFLASKDVQLLATAREVAVKVAGEKPEARPAAAAPAADDGTVPGKLFKSDEDLASAIAADRDQPDDVQGVLVHARVDPESWITAGLGASVHALVSGRNIFSPLKIDKGTNPVIFETAEKLVSGGYIWEENRKQLALKPLVMVQPQGRGVVIGFTADPNYRAYMDGLNTLFLNAVFRGPAHASPQVSEE